MAKERGFKMEEGVRKSSAVTKYVTQVLARAGKDHRNTHLASTLLDDAVSRQTERVHLKGTISKDSLLTLLEVSVPSRSSRVYAQSIKSKVQAALLPTDAMKVGACHPNPTPVQTVANRKPGACRKTRNPMQRQEQQRHGAGARTATQTDESVSCCGDPRQVDVMPPEDGSGPGSGPGSAKQLEACMEELDNVAGLSSVKEFVKSMRAQLMLDAERRAAGLPTIGQGTLHMVFSGNPVRAYACPLCTRGCRQPHRTSCEVCEPSADEGVARHESAPTCRNEATTAVPIRGEWSCLMLAYPIYPENGGTC